MYYFLTLKHLRVHNKSLKPMYKANVFQIKKELNNSKSINRIMSIL